MSRADRLGTAVLRRCTFDGSKVVLSFRDGIVLSGRSTFMDFNTVPPYRRRSCLVLYDVTIWLLTRDRAVIALIDVPFRCALLYSWYYLYISMKRFEVRKSNFRGITRILRLLTGTNLRRLVA
jgi:hypothetical protein